MANVLINDNNNNNDNNKKKSKQMRERRESFKSNKKVGYHVGSCPVFDCINTPC